MGKSARVTSNRVFSVKKVTFRELNQVWGARGILCHREKCVIGESINSCIVRGLSFARGIVDCLQ